MKTEQLHTSAGVASRLSAFLGLEHGEARPVTSLMGLNLAVSTAFVFVQTSAFGLFIEAFGSHTLPYAYFSVAILSSLVAYLYLQVSQRVSFATGLYINLGFLAAMCMVFWLGLRSSAARGFIFLLPFWFQTLVNLANLVVWHLAGHIFHVRQAKRLFGLIVAGNWIANIVGGALVASFLGDSSPSDLYLLAAIALALSIFVLRAALRNYRESPTHAPTVRTRKSGRTAARAALAHPYSRLIFAYTLLWWLAFFILENIFFHQVEGELESSTALASFLGWQLTVMGVVALFTTSVLTSRVVRRYGLRLGLLTMPAVVTTSIVLLAVGGTLGWSTSFLFWTATAARTLNIALGFSLSQAMGSLLFQPLQGQVRGAAQTISEGIIQPLAIGLAGVILVILNATLGLNAVGLAYVFMAVAIPWFWSIFALARQYPLVMSAALKKRALGESTTLLFDRSAMDLLRRALHQSQPGQALYALSQLEQLAASSWPAILTQELPRLLQHPAAEVRLEALQHVLRLHLSECAPLVRARLDHETQPQVSGALIRVLAASRDPASENLVVGALNSPDRVLQAGAILGVLTAPASDIAALALAALDELVRSHDARGRRAACQILAELAHPSTASILAKLIGDDELGVRQAALRAARRQPNPLLIRPVLDACIDPACARAAENALSALAQGYPQAVLQEARRIQQEGFAGARGEIVLRVLGEMRGAESSALLLAALETRDPQVRLGALESLDRLGHRAMSAAQTLELVRSEMLHAAWITGALVCDGAFKGWETLRRALETDLRDTRGRILLLLSFIYDARAVRLARGGLEKPGSAHSAMALETIDALLPSMSKPLVLPLLEDLPPAERAQQWRAAGMAVPQLAAGEVLLGLIVGEESDDHSTWARMCAIHVIGKARVDDCLDVLEKQSFDNGPAALEGMRKWSLATGGRARGSIGVNQMLSTVERVLILKSAPLFAETSDSVLAEVAELVEEKSYETDQVIFQKGDPGDSLYVIVSGSVRVWDGDRLLNELKEGDAFGELALLDPEPRLGTVKAAESTQLLRLAAPGFQEVLDSQPEVSSAILRVVTRYLRGQLQFAREASARIRALESLTPMSQAEAA